jgi:malate synthase
MQGDLSPDLSKDDKVTTRTLNENRIYISADGGEVRLRGRSLVLIRYVGHLKDSALFCIAMELKCLRA